MQDETPHPRQPSEAPVAQRPPWPRPGRRRLEGAHVVLEPLDPARHGAALAAAARDDDPERWRFLPYGPFVDAPIDDHLAGCAASEDPLFFAILAGGVAEGVMSYLEIAPEHGIVEIGHIWLGPRLMRTRASTEAMRLTVGHAIDDLGYRRMQWKCDALNAPSRAAARRLGFRYEGTLFAHRVVKGRNRDTAYYSILAGEWPPLRAAMDDWLADANWDEAGRPRSSLSARTAALVG